MRPAMRPLPTSVSRAARLLLPLRRPALALALVAVAAAAAGAHDTWLVPTRAAVPAGNVVTLDLTSGTTFPTSETAIQPARVQTARLRLGDAVDTLPTPRRAGHALRFRVPLRTAGVATLWVSLRPNALSLDSALVMQYLHEIGAPDSVRVAYLRQLPIDGRRRWRERYAKHATTYVLVTSPLRPRPAGDASWAEPTGMPFELVPLQDPTTLRAGDTLTVRVLRRGMRVPGIAVGLASAGGRTTALRHTDAGGHVAFVLPADGRWLLRATDLRRSARADTDWESDFATLTLSVR